MKQGKCTIKRSSLNTWLLFFILIAALFSLTGCIGGGLIGGVAGAAGVGQAADEARCRTEFPEMEYGDCMFMIAPPSKCVDRVGCVELESGS